METETDYRELIEEAKQLEEMLREQLVQLDRLESLVKRVEAQQKHSGRVQPSGVTQA